MAPTIDDSRLLRNEQNDEECDATDDDSSIVAGFINSIKKLHHQNTDPIKQGDDKYPFERTDLVEMHIDREQ
jgi:hypothetical protein